MKELPKSKLTKAQLKQIGHVVIYCQANGINPLSQPFRCDGRTANALFKRDMIEVDPNNAKNNNPVWVLTDVGMDAYFKQKTLEKTAQKP